MPVNKNDAYLAANASNATPADAIITMIELRATAEGAGLDEPIRFYKNGLPTGTEIMDGLEVPYIDAMDESGVLGRYYSLGFTDGDLFSSKTDARGNTTISFDYYGAEALRLLLKATAALASVEVIFRQYLQSQLDMPAFTQRELAKAVSIIESSRKVQLTLTNRLTEAGKFPNKIYTSDLIPSLQ